LYLRQRSKFEITVGRKSTYFHKFILRSIKTGLKGDNIYVNQLQAIKLQSARKKSSIFRWGEVYGTYKLDFSTNGTC
jgi:hypothetical protein